MTSNDISDNAIRESDPARLGKWATQQPPSPTRLSAQFAMLLVLNLVAAYVPGLFWVPGLPGSGSSALIYLFSPVAPLLLFLMGSSSLILPTSFLGSFICVIMTLSFLLRRSRIAMIAMPVLLFFLCLIQGLWFAEAIRGIDAIGNS